MTVRRIVSGGQTGVDRAALDAAMDAGIEHGGFCPRGRRAEDGVIPQRYRLDELPERDYAARTEANVIHSDATLVLVRGRPSGGTALTLRLARRHARPHLVVDLAVTPPVEACATIASWLGRSSIEVLNVAGPRESTAPGIGADSREVLRATFDALVDGCGE